MNASAARLAATLLLPGLAMTAPVRAAEYSWVPGGQISVQSRTNARMVPDGDVSSDSLAADLGLSWQRQTERMLMSIAPRVRAQRYRRDDDLDRDEQQLAAALGWQGEKAAFDASASFVRDTTLTSELGTTGLTQGNQRHEAVGATLGASRQFTERTTMQVSASWLDTRYPGNAQSELGNYRYSSAQLGAQRMLSERTVLSTSLSAGRMTSEQSVPSENAAVNLGLRINLSELWTTNLSTGPSWRRRSGTTDQGMLYRAELSRRGEGWTLSALAGRSESPTGRGLLTQRDDISLRWTAQISERTGISANLSEIRSVELLDAAQSSADSVRYWRVDAALSRRLTQNWSLVASAAHALQRARALYSDTARGSEFGLALSWSGDRHVN